MTAPGIVSCGGCHGRCCTEYVVSVTGADIWRISRARHLAPERFVQPDLEESPTRAGFLLEPGGPTFTVILQHQHLPRKHICGFLDGEGRCSIYTDRPLACQTYPMELRKGIAAPRDELLCPAGSWMGMAQVQAAWRERLLAQAQAWDTYALVVAAWNGAVRSRHSEAEAALAQYLAYLMQAYDLVRERPAETAMDALHTLAQRALDVPDA